jgi:intracellular sulfur oxidation DsrE/DsrF family protein
MRRIKFILPMLILAAVFMTVAAPAYAHEKGHKVAIHVDDNDPKRMNMALNNAQNISKYYESRGEKVQIEIVAYGPGLIMLREDKSPVKERIAAMSLEMDNLSFAAFGNTQANMKKKEGMDIPIISEATIVPSGVVRLMQLQEEGWSYIRP